MIKVYIKKIFYRLWNSPTFTSWGSFLAQTTSFFLVLPLVLKTFEVEEVTLWYLFSMVISLQYLADFGFKNTFSRAISFAMGGKTEITVINEQNNNENIKENNWNLVGDIIGNARIIYFRISVFVFVSLAVFGNIALYHNLVSVKDTLSAAIAWAIIIFTSTIKFYGSIYEFYLLGTNNVALVKRWEALSFLGSSITNFIVILWQGTLLSLVISSQVWVLFDVFRNRTLSRYLYDGRFRLFKSKKLDKKLFKSIWQAAWKSGIASIMNMGLVNLTGVIYAQIGNIESVASYLLSLKVLNTIRNVSMAPFYSKLPLFATLRAKGNIRELKNKAKFGMQLSHWVFVLLCVGVGLFVNPILQIIHSKTPFVTPLIWSLLALAYFFHRFGAMHIQLYMTTHHVISHVADTVSGVIFLLVSVLLVNYLDIMAFPIGMIVGYLGFYCWYSAKYSYNSINEKFFEYEVKVAFGPFICLALYFIFIL